MKAFIKVDFPTLVSPSNNIFISSGGADGNRSISVFGSKDTNPIL
jgi:hypothetical protein